MNTVQHASVIKSSSHTLSGCFHKKTWNRVHCQRFEKRSKTRKRLKERLLIGRNRTKRAHFRGSPLYLKTHKRLKERFSIGRNRTKCANFRGSPLQSVLLMSCVFLLFPQFENHNTKTNCRWTWTGHWTTTGWGPSKCDSQCFLYSSLHHLSPLASFPDHGNNPWCALGTSMLLRMNSSANVHMNLLMMEKKRTLRHEYLSQIRWNSVEIYLWTWTLKSCH